MQQRMTAMEAKMGALLRLLKPDGAGCSSSAAKDGPPGKHGSRSRASRSRARRPPAPVKVGADFSCRSQRGQGSSSSGWLGRLGTSTSTRSKQPAGTAPRASGLGPQGGGRGGGGAGAIVPGRPPCTGGKPKQAREPGAEHPGAMASLAVLDDIWHMTYDLII